jgi:ketosteroid isomerase-like protein
VSLENLEVARRAYEDFQLGDLDAALERLDPSFRLIDPTRVDTIEYFGRTGFDKWLTEWLSMWDEWRFVAEQFVDSGPDVVMLCRQWGRGKDSGAEVEQKFAMVWTFEGNAIVEMRYFEGWQDALEAVGMPE